MFVKLIKMKIMDAQLFKFKQFKFLKKFKRYKSKSICEKLKTNM